MAIRPILYFRSLFVSAVTSRFSNEFWGGHSTERPPKVILVFSTCSLLFRFFKCFSMFFAQIVLVHRYFGRCRETHSTHEHSHYVSIMHSGHKGSHGVSKHFVT